MEDFIICQSHYSCTTEVCWIFFLTNFVIFRTLAHIFNQDVFSKKLEFKMI